MTAELVVAAKTNGNGVTDTHQLLANLKARMEELEQHCHFEHPPSITRVKTAAPAAVDDTNDICYHQSLTNDESVASTVSMSISSSSSSEDDAATSSSSTTTTPVTTVITPLHNADARKTPSTSSSSSLTPSAQARRERIAKLRQTKRKAEQTQTSLFDGLVHERKLLQTRNEELEDTLRAQTKAWDDERQRYRQAIQEMNTLVKSLQVALCRTSMGTEEQYSNSYAAAAASCCSSSSGDEEESAAVDAAATTSNTVKEQKQDTLVQQGKGETESPPEEASSRDAAAPTTTPLPAPEDGDDNIPSSLPDHTTTKAAAGGIIASPAKALAMTFENTRYVIEQLDEECQQMAIVCSKQSFHQKTLEDVIQAQRERIVELEEDKSLQAIKIEGLQDMVLQSLQALDAADGGDEDDEGGRHSPRLSCTPRRHRVAVQAEAARAILGRLNHNNDSGGGGLGIGQKVQQARGGIKNLMLEQRQRAGSSRVLKASRNLWATMASNTTTTSSSASTATTTTTSSSSVSSSSQSRGEVHHTKGHQQGWIRK